MAVFPFCLDQFEAVLTQIDHGRGNAGDIFRAEAGRERGGNLPNVNDDIDGRPPRWQGHDT